MTELGVITYSAFLAVVAIVIIFFPIEDDDDQDGGKMIPIFLKKS